MKGKSIHDPEFSEFGFGYTVTNGLTHFRSGTLSPWSVFGNCKKYFRHYPFWDEEDICRVLKSFGLTCAEAIAVIDANGAPFIPTQHLENKFPVDVALNSNGIFYFLQFKRSRCVVFATRKNITEVKAGKSTDFNLPFYRVGFYGKGDRAQRKNLETLENSLKYINSAFVRYAVPAFHTLAELSRVHQNGLAAHIDGRSPVMCFKASAFTLPGTGNHHISYDGIKTSGWRFSGEPEQVEGIRPLISELGELASDAAPLGETMSKLCNALDGHAKTAGLPNRPKEMDDDALLRMFGFRASKPKGDKTERGETPGMAFLQASIEIQERTKELANGIRKLLKYPIDEDETYPDGVSSRMEFLEDFYGADYRCQQIIGHPLIVGVRK